MSGTVTPTWSPPRSPGMPLVTSPRSPAIMYPIIRNVRCFLWLRPANSPCCGYISAITSCHATREAPPAWLGMERADHDRGRLEGCRSRAARHHARPAPPHPRLRGDGPRTGRGRPRARPRALQHRPGGGRRRLDRLAAPGRRGQRLAPRPPPVPRQAAPHVTKGVLDLGSLVTPEVAE